MLQAMAAGAVAQARADIADVVALAETLLSDPATAEAMAAAGRAWFEGEHTWAHRAATIRAAGAGV